MSATTELRVHRVHHTLRPAHDDQRGPLARMAASFPDALAAAFDDCGLDRASVLCMPRLECRVRLSEATASFGDPDVIAARWAASIARRVSAAVAAAPAPDARSDSMRIVHFDEGDDAVWFATPRAVVADIVRSAIAGSRERRWAWELSGVVRPTDPADTRQLAGVALQRDPASIAPTIGRLARRDPGLLVSWPWPTWIELATTWVERSRLVPRSLLEVAHLVAADAEAAPTPGTAAMHRRIGAIPGGPALLSIIHRTFASTAGADVRSRVAVAQLMLAAVAPELADGPAHVGSLAALLTPATSGDPAPARAELAAQRTVGSDASSTAPHRTLDETAPVGGTAADYFAACDTNAGGLLYLLHVVIAMDLPSRVASSAHPLAAMPLASVLSLLGQALSGRPVTDPAVLAFHGRLPDDTAVEDEWQLDTDLSIVTAVDHLVDEIDSRLTDALAAVLHEHPHWTRQDLRSFVIDRAATISGDPGWIDIIFAADTVSVDIRRAGLDLDPQYVAALGCVIRFRYV